MLILFLVVLLLVPNVLGEARKGHVKLLAVKDSENGDLEGGLADLFLEIDEGQGRVFLETFPLTRTDTQMSTRFAKTIACDYAGVDCRKYDFFYTITADSPIIAGPSAGSSLAGLTVALLLDQDIDESVVGTGTINSGGLIGPIGGLKAKIVAAGEAGMTKVLIPEGERIGREENETIDIDEFSEELGIEIIEVSTIGDVVEHYTGLKKEEKNIDIDINQEYSSRMKELAVQLCDRSDELRETLKGLSDDKINQSLINVTAANIEIGNLTDKGKDAYAIGEFYSSASYCFGANVQLSNLILQSQGLSVMEIENKVFDLRQELNDFSLEIDGKEKNTITDLETFMVVKERIVEAEEVTDDVLTTLNSTNSTVLASRILAYGVERFNSAKSWSSFFGSEGRKFKLDEDVLKRSCQDKLSEVEERVQYAEIYFPGSLQNVRDEMDKAYEDFTNKKYELCLFKASKAKASVDVVLGVFGVDPEEYENVLDKKLSVVKDNLAEQTVNGIFPIIGYSYYEYANSLRGENTLSGLLYSEYALELGNLDIYFEDEGFDVIEFDTEFKYEMYIILIGGVVGGFFLSLLVRKDKKKKKSKHITIKLK